jgi:hypothetical protein
MASDTRTYEYDVPSLPGTDADAGLLTRSTDGAYLLIGLYEMPPGFSTTSGEVIVSRNRGIASFFYDDSIWWYIEAPRACATPTTSGFDCTDIGNAPAIYGALGDGDYNTWLCFTEIFVTPKLYSVPATGSGQAHTARDCRGIAALGGDLLIATRFGRGDDDSVGALGGFPFSGAIATARVIPIVHAFTAIMEYRGLAAAVVGGAPTVFVGSAFGLLVFRFRGLPLTTARIVPAYALFLGAGEDGGE